VKQTIVVECELADSPQKVWKALTVPELLARWLLPNDIRPQEGAKFSLNRHSPAERIDCTILEVDPHHLLRMSWRSLAHENLDSVVTFELYPTTSGGTLPRLVHTGFESGARPSMATLLATAICQLKIDQPGAKALPARAFSPVLRRAA
jgi:uncharacterized protein YndB with AHSA1/START domain